MLCCLPVLPCPCFTFQPVHHFQPSTGCYMGNFWWLHNHVTRLGLASRSSCSSIIDQTYTNSQTQTLSPLSNWLLTTLGDGSALDAITGFLKISCLSKFTGYGQTLLLGMDKGKAQTLGMQGRSSPGADQERRTARRESEAVMCWTGSLG